MIDIINIVTEYSFFRYVKKLYIVNDDRVCVSGFAEQLPNGAG